MIAELHNKISKTGSNLSDRLEDQLTGNFFGSLRYLPFDIGIKPILQESVFPEKLLDCLYAFRIEEWDSKIHFWKNFAWEGTEPDVVIDLGDLVILVEVKLDSGLSSDDDSDTVYEAGLKLENKYDESCNQLVRESKLLISKYPNVKKRVLLLLAKETPATEIYKDVSRRYGESIKASGVDFGYITWQKALTALRKISCADAFQRLIKQDLDDLLTLKGFEQFDSFSGVELPTIDPDDYWPFTFEYVNSITPIFVFSFIKRIREDLFYEFK